MNFKVKFVGVAVCFLQAHFCRDLNTVLAAVTD